MRAVLEGIAQRGADLLDAAEREVGLDLGELRVDGGMSVNRFFVQRLADFSGRAVAVSSEREATTRGAGLMALVERRSPWPGRRRDALVAGIRGDALAVRRRTTARRESWVIALERAARTIPELSDVSF